VGARILSVVDCFDALTSDRPYRPRLPDAEAIDVLMERRGNMYDPGVVDKFMEVYESIAPDDDYVRGKSEAFSAIAESSQSSNEPTTSPLVDISASSEEVTLLHALREELASPPSLVECGDSVVKHLKRMLPFTLCTLYVYDGRTDELVARYAAGEHADMVRGARVELGQRLSGWVAANRRTIVNSDPVLDLGDFARSLEPGLRSSLSAPLVTEKELVGVMTLYSPNASAYTEDHRRIVDSAAIVIAQALSRLENERSPTWTSGEPKPRPPSVH
jgi:transcriptional regulator with GAF, ATPase, and Fis domain